MGQILFELGLLGRSLSHSFSARYFTDKFAGGNIAARYLNFELPDISLLPELIRSRPLLRGLNVTIPYKQAVIPYLDSLSPLAREAGAVNTIVIRRSPAGITLHGHNTDIEGLRLSLLPMLPSSRSGLRALILGTGGASRAAEAVLRALSIPYSLVSRTASRGCLTYADLTPALMREHQLIINTTPAGTWPDTEVMPPLPVELLSDRHILQDLIYNPPLTRLMREALLRGARVRSGLRMLHAQAEAAWQLWNA